MHIEKRHYGNYAVLKFSGNMAESLEASGLFDLIRDLVQDSVYRIIADMKDVKWINSTGIGALMGCLSYLDAHNAELIVINMPEKVKEVLSLMDLLPYFKRHTTLNQAITGAHNYHTIDY